MKKCKTCGKLVVGSYFYCSNNCRKIAHKQRQEQKRVTQKTKTKEQSIEIDKSFKIFLFEIYLESLKEIDFRIDKVVFALGVLLFFKEEIEKFYNKNIWEKLEKAKIDLNYKRLDKISYTKIVRDVYDWYLVSPQVF